MRDLKFRARNKQANIWLNVDEMPIISANSDSMVLELCTDYVEFQQYTGLKDRTGREIYEGDLMNHPEFYKNVPLEVTFEDGCFRMGGWECTRTDLTRGEVIGNIYEEIK